MYKEKVKELREDKSIPQKDIANILGIARGLYSQYEIEYTIMPINHLIVLTNYFNVSLDYVFEFTNKKKYFNNSNLNNPGIRLKEFRKEHKLTQEQLAKELNTNRSVIANYERERNLIATPFLYMICDKYKISADYLLGRIDSPKYIK